MLKVNEVKETQQSVALSYPAMVVSGPESEGLLWVRFERDGEVSERWAKPAIAPCPGIGNRVLLAPGDNDEAYIIGILEAGEVSTRAATEIVTSNGSSACIEGSPGEESIKVFDGRGALIFEHHTDAGKSIISVPSGDLELRAPEGDIRLASGKNIRVITPGDVSIEGGRSVELLTSNPEKEGNSRFHLNQRGVKLVSERIAMTARRADMTYETARVQGRVLIGRFKEVRVVIGHLETLANRVIQKARDVYCHVEGLHQLRAKRVRSIAEETYSIKGKKVYVKADKDVKVKGDRIHLG